MGIVLVNQQKTLKKLKTYSVGNTPSAPSEWGSPDWGWIEDWPKARNGFQQWRREGTRRKLRMVAIVSTHMGIGLVGDLFNVGTDFPSLVISWFLRNTCWPRNSMRTPMKLMLVHKNTILVAELETKGNNVWRSWFASAQPGSKQISNQIGWFVVTTGLGFVAEPLIVDKLTYMERQLHHFDTSKYKWNLTYRTKSESHKRKTYILLTMSGTLWTPELRGCCLVPCKLISSLVTNDRVPEVTNVKDAPWMVKLILPELDRAPNIREELINSIIGIWHLRVFEMKRPLDTNWQDHLEAWLVSMMILNQLNSFLHLTIQTRHRDLCFSAGIAPFGVVECYWTSQNCLDICHRTDFHPLHHHRTQGAERVLPREWVLSFLRVFY